MKNKNECWHWWIEHKKFKNYWNCGSNWKVNEQCFL